MKVPTANDDTAGARSDSSPYRRAEDTVPTRAFLLPDPMEAVTPESMHQVLHDLRLHQVELETQNAELRRTQAQLDTSQARYFDFYDMAPIGYCTVSETGLILQANIAAAALIGVARTQLLQQPITRFIYPDDQDSFYLMEKKIIGVNQPSACELRMVKEDETIFWAHLDAMRVQQGGVGCLRLVMTNITERKQAESELLLANKVLAFESEEKGKRAAELLSANEDIKHYIAELQSALMSTVDVVMTVSEMRDPYTAGHERRVGEIAAAIGNELGFDARRLEGLKVAGYLHDIGKISVPSEILSKPGQLSATQLLLIREHTQAGFDVLKGVQFPWPVALVALQHHERIDGTGYPQGLKGDAILLEARIMAVADVVEAMSSHRPYRAALGLEKALAEIKRGRSTAYDPMVVDACLRLFAEKAFSIPA